MLLRNFNRQFSVIRVEQFGNPRIASLSKLELPRGSILHYIPTDGVSEIGPPQNHPILEKAEKLIQVNHVLHLAEHGTVGRPRRVETAIARDVIQYHRINKRLRMMHNTKLVERDDRVMMVENYAPLRRVYRYPETLMSWYERWYNLFLTVVTQLGHDSSTFQRQNYLLLTIPTKLPSIAKLRKAEKRRDLNTLDSMRDDNVLFFLELWTWFGPNRDRGMLGKLTAEQLKRINVIVSFNDRFINMNLGELDFWRKGDTGGRIDPIQMQRRLYKSIIQLATEQLPEEVKSTQPVSVREDADGEIVETELLEDSGEFDPPELTDGDDRSVEEEIEAFDEQVDLDEEEDFEIVQTTDEVEVEDVKHTTITIDNGIKRESLRYIEAGQLTTKEYQRMLDQSESYKAIPNPFGEGTLADMLEVTSEEVALEEELLLEDPVLLDPGLAKSTVTNLNRKYIQKVLPKDICSSIMAVQKMGIVVNDYKAEEVVDAANGLVYHTLKITPVKGESSTIHFPTPLFDDEGYWTANDVRYTMRRQRVDLPIRKTAPDTVALTTFYNKNFIRRSDKVVNDWPKWLTNNIITAGIDASNLSVSDLRFANVFDPTVELPRDYTSVSQRLSGFTSQGIVFNFDYSTVDKTFGVEKVAELKEQKLVPVGKSRGATYVMDPFNMMYKEDGKGLTEVGTLAEVLGFDISKAPKEHSELSMMGKAIPTGLVIAYYYGLESALKEFGVDYRLAEAGERVKADEGDLIIPCRDGKYVITYANQEQALIFNGLRHYVKITRDFSMEDLNRQDVYLNLIQKDGLTVRYLLELDQMDAMYVDPISERILKKMGEPTTFRGLIRRANEMLTYDQHPHETDMDSMHIYGHQRIAGAVYGQLVKAIRDSRNKPGSRKKIILPPNQIWSAIAQDPSVMPASDSNPIQSIKEADVVTFGGTGGRSRRSMVKRTRVFGKNNLGVISGDNVDSGDVGITEYLTNNPIFDDVDGLIKPLDRDNLEVNQYLSFSNQLAPGIMHDDGHKRRLYE